MKKKLRLPKSLLLLSLSIGNPLHSELPTLPDPQFGVFALAEEKNLELEINEDGELIISPYLGNGEKGSYRKIPVLFGIEETLADGKTRVLSFLPESLESPQPPTDKFKEATITGKVAEGASFELTIQQKRGVVTIGGKITDAGPLTAENLRFIASPQILNFYGSRKIELEDDPEAFEELLEDDYVKLKLSDGKRHKYEASESPGEGSDDVSGPGIAEVEAKIQIIKNTITFTASKGSSIKLRNTGTAHFYSGYYADWTSQNDDARLVIEVD